MRAAVYFALFLTVGFAAVSSAQTRGGGGMSSRSGGGARASHHSGTVASATSIAGAPRGTRTPNVPGSSGFGRPGGIGHSPRRTILVPYGIPYFPGYYGGGGYGNGYGDPGYGNGYYPNGNYGNGYGPDDGSQRQPIVQSAPPIVIINRDYQPEHLNPVMRDYSNTPLPESAIPPDPARGQLRVYDNTVVNNADRDPDEPTIYLLAFKDQKVVPALAYWVEGETLHYITRQHAMNVISLSLVDRDFSMKLNRERNVEFKLP